jgi:hypothetical protein
MADRERHTDPATPSSKGMAVWQTVRTWIEMDRKNRDVLTFVDDEGNACVEVRQGGKKMRDAIKDDENPWTTAARVISALAVI